MKPLSGRAALPIILIAALLFCIFGPGMEWRRGRRDHARLQPVVERFDAQGADLRLAGSTRSRAVVLIVGTVPDAAMKEQLRLAVMDVVQDEQETKRQLGNVRTNAELDALGQ